MPAAQPANRCRIRTVYIALTVTQTRALEKNDIYNDRFCWVRGTLKSTMEKISTMQANATT